MKVPAIVNTNTKGQIVIPKHMRSALGINENIPLLLKPMGNGIYISPIEGIITKADSENFYTKILERTRGAWAGDDWEQTRKRRRKIELEASKRRKQAW